MLKQEGKTARDLVLFILILAGAYAFIHFNAKQPNPLDTPHIQYAPGDFDDTTSRISYPQSVPYKSNKPEQDESGLSIVINEQTYRASAMITPTLPIIARFHHGNSAVTKIRMQHPQRPKLHFIYPVNQDIRIENHESYMRRGIYSSSEFLAQDEQGHTYDRILIEFKPNP